MCYRLGSRKRQGSVHAAIVGVGAQTRWAQRPSLLRQARSMHRKELAVRRAVCRAVVHVFAAIDCRVHTRSCSATPLIHAPPIRTAWHIALHMRDLYACTDILCKRHADNGLKQRACTCRFLHQLGLRVLRLLFLPFHLDCAHLSTHRYSADFSYLFWSKWRYCKQAAP